MFLQNVWYDEDGYVIAPPQTEDEYNAEYNFELSQNLRFGRTNTQSLFACDDDIEIQKRLVLKRHRHFDDVRRKSDSSAEAIRYARYMLQKSVDAVHILDPKIPVNNIETAVNIIKAEIESMCDELGDVLASKLHVSD